MHTVIVIPCYNERELIAVTAGSLGFGLSAAATPPDTTLALVDNGSEDGTDLVLEHIRGTSRTGSVLLLSEPVRGYVPPRHRGVLATQDLANDLSIAADDMLILQADADTTYEEGYVAAMQEAFRTAGPNTLIEGMVHPPARFLHEHPGFQRLADVVDAAIEPLNLPEEFDIVVDDKVAGFSLATYLAWGGHRREFTSKGVELHAETTRLFIRGKIHGGSRVGTPALARPSRRKIIDNPVRQFSTAGFPREDAWWDGWSAGYAGPRHLAAFEDPAMLPALAPAIASRKAHIIVLLGALPLFIERLLHSNSIVEVGHPLLEEFLSEMSEVSAEFSSGNLAPIFENAFELLDAWAVRFDGIRL